MNVLYHTLDTRWLSSGLWKGMPLDALLNPWDRRGGFAFVDDFRDFAGVLSSTAGVYYSEGHRYLTYQTASTLLTTVADSVTPASLSPIHLGAIQFGPTSGVADNDEIHMMLGGHPLTPYGPFPFAVIPGVSNDLVFEARFKVADSSASIGDFFIGLAGATGVLPVATGVPITSSDAFATTQSLLGFSKLGADADTINLCFERASGTVHEEADIATMADATYIKAGFRFNGETKTLDYYIDGEKVATLGTGHTGATPWPNDYLTPLVSTVQIDGTTAQNFTLDWWACAQLPPLKPFIEV